MPEDRRPVTRSVTRPVRRPLVDQVIASLGELIEHENLAPGDRLPTESAGRSDRGVRERGGPDAAAQGAADPRTAAAHAGAYLPLSIMRG